MSTDAAGQRPTLKTAMRRRLPLLLAFGLLAAIAVCAGVGYAVWATLIGPPPGVGPKAEEGYQACAPIIDALARYQAQHAAYPETLDALVPAFLAAVPAADGRVEFAYRLAGTSYELEFRYVGPGMNICTYTPETGWDCEGFY